ncbi:MAG: hypothetical protein R3281_00240 [Balneolaceae bacterium]|nr:hypothetical protein [Balneolaceae bacterium]
MSFQDEEHDNVFHERISIMREKGYRGFSVQATQKKWDGIQVTARNSKGRTVSAFGETDEEAYKKLIDKIDQALEVH